MERWSGKVALVTGASSGIGYATAEELAKKGLIVVGLARRVELIEKLSKKYIGKVHAIKCDLSKEEDILSAFEWVEKTLGGVDLLINNAAHSALEKLSEGTTEGWRQVLNVNILATSICTREALKTMRKRGDNGQIINISSTLGHRVAKNTELAMYAASKSAIRSLSNSLKIELNDKNSSIKVTNMSLGSVHTELARRAIKVFLDVDIAEVTEPTPDGFMSAQDVADTIINVISMKPHVQIEDMILLAKGDPY